MYKLRSVIPWTGGKHPLRSKVMEYIPKNFLTYHEPFSGACTMLLTIQPKKAKINDINPWIVLVYHLIKVAPLKLLQALKKLDGTDAQNEAKFNNIVKLFNTNKKKLQPLIPESLNNVSDELLKKLILPISQFYYICKFSYGGHVWFDEHDTLNALTHSSKIIGRHLFNEKLIMDIHSYFTDKGNDIRFYHGSYEKILYSTKAGDFCYFDPPYYNSKFENNIAKYSKDLFDNKSHQKLAQKMIDLHKKGVFVLQSNCYNAELLKMYADFQVVKIKVRRTLYVREDEKNNNFFECLIMNYNV
jgi:DNA adenine methylase